MNNKKAITLVNMELEEAQEKFMSFHNYHEGYAVIKEELDELWEEIKNKNQSIEKLKKEAKQVGAMAVRFLVDLC